MPRGIKWLIFAVIIILVLSLAVMPHLGTYLVADHGLAEADAIVVLMGGPDTKMLVAADLYLEGYADKIITAQAYTGTLEPDIESRFLAKAETERSRLIFIDLVCLKKRLSFCRV